MEDKTLKLSKDKNKPTDKQIIMMEYFEGERRNIRWEGKKIIVAYKVGA